MKYYKIKTNTKKKKKEKEAKSKQRAKICKIELLQFERSSKSNKFFGPYRIY